jgi:hypothetical protein
MSHKQLKRKGRKKAVAVLGAAGVLSLAGGASRWSGSGYTEGGYRVASRHHAQ